VKDAQTARALARLERSQRELEVATDALSLARARETLRGAQWELERLLNKIFGVKQEITHINSDLGDKLRRSRERVIEHESAVPPSLPAPVIEDVEADDRVADQP